MEDDHVDRPGVEAQQCVQLTGTNSSFGLNALINQCPSKASSRKVSPLSGPDDAMNKITIFKKPVCFFSCVSPAWWLLRSDQTRSHPELGRQTLSRQWYYVSRPGRVGRRQACEAQEILFTSQPTPTAALARRAAVRVLTRVSRKQTPTIAIHCRGVEQPGSSSGS